MQFALVAHDRPNAVAQRLEIRPAHLGYLEGLGAALVLAGPFLNDKGEGVGTILVIEAADEAEARATLARDPYALAGLFNSVTLKPWKLSINKTK